MVVGINLLREGLDLPEVSLVAILDADKEGYLRSTPSLIQTMGRAARHIDGHVVMYADSITDSMRRAIDETERRRQRQESHNISMGVRPEGIRKAIRDITDALREVAEPRATHAVRKDLGRDELARVIKDLEREMKEAARQLEFERAAILRDEMTDLKKLLVSQTAADLETSQESESAPGKSRKIPKQNNRWESN